MVTATEWRDCTNDKEVDEDDRNKNMVGRELTLKAPIFETVMSVVILLNTAGQCFQWRNPGFPFKNPGFPFKNPDFLIKNPDFRLKMLIL